MKRTLVAFLAAPILSSLLPAWFLHLHHPEKTAISGLVVVCCLFYLIQAAIGIPAYFLAPIRRRYVWYFLVIGFLAFSALYIAVIVFTKTKIQIADGLFQTVYFGVSGAAIGLVFWLIARPDKKISKPLPEVFS
jgi:hypothetical protein